MQIFQQQHHRRFTGEGAKGIPHFLDDRKWSGHDWNYWRDMFPHYLSLLKS